MVYKCCSYFWLQGPGVSEDDFCGNLIMDEMDMAFEKYDELFGTAYNSSKDLFEHGGLESLFEKHEVLSP